MTKTSVAVILAFGLSAPALAQEIDLGGTTFSNTYSNDSFATTSTTYAWPIGGDVYVGGNASTTYYQPSYTAGTPSMGTTAGSGSDTTYSGQIVYTW